jgi:hypothetical protein
MFVKRNNDEEFQFVYVDDRYTEYLQQYGDSRVSKNVNFEYQRPYIGVMFSMGNTVYFAPLTTSSKGKKLRDFPK